jgi:hypothetical protein
VSWNTYDVAKITSNRLKEAKMQRQAGKTEEEEEMFRYLDVLRESGVTNMYGAGPYLVDAFGLSRGDSHKVLAAWMRSYEKQEIEHADKKGVVEVSKQGADGERLTAA